ncbi:MAG: 16S rRNA (adenine(1518)-N(6)/adenine(1519)-N(6))-dimethyltransferase RsmA [bacterium]|nr:16S rRNA (adenine(1518)-N(6)/adenine(1519)-N(6))-dimethyltransferase RsmA [bacterium]
MSERLEYIYSIKPRKSLGQHYLRDKSILKKIIDSLNLTGKEVILEIGSGHGELSFFLAQKSREVWAVEIDPSSIYLLKERLRDFNNVNIIHGDILKFQSDRFFDLIVGNIPYYISGILLGNLSERWNYKRAVFTLQREVGKRLTAKPGTKDYGVLTLAVWYNHRVKILFDIPKECFYPVPKVDSVVVELEKTENKDIEKDFFMKVVKSAFSSRRKMLKNVLLDLGLEREKIIEILQSLGIDPRRRGETLSLEEFLSLSRRIYETIFSG